MPIKDIECPYCGHGFDICNDDGFGLGESEKHHQECPSCEKSFVFTSQLSWSHYPKKADCLNDGSHDMERTRTYPPQYAKMRCKVCGHEEPI